MPRWLLLSLKFLALWLFVFISYLILKLGFNYVFRGFLDLRKVAILEYLLIPVGLTVVYWFGIWFQTRRVRRTLPPTSDGSSWSPKVTPATLSTPESKAMETS